MCREKTPDDGQRNFSKRVEFYSKNKFEKLVHLVGFIIRTGINKVNETHDVINSDYNICLRSLQCVKITINCRINFGSD